MRSRVMLAEAEPLEDEFLTLISHELRTPLTSIIGYLELALDEEDAAPLDPQRRLLLEVVDRNAQRLLRLVGDLLFAAQVRTGSLALRRDPVDLARVVEQAGAAAAAPAEAQGVELSVGPADEMILAQADADRLGQMLDNLLSNAIKFTPAGGRVRVTCTAGDDGVAQILVQDTGVGIAAADQAELFAPFVRAAAAAGQGVPGAGLGLAIVDAIVRGHGGTVTLESALGAGTTVLVRLPPGGAAAFSARGRPAPAAAAPAG